MALTSALHNNIAEGRDPFDLRGVASGTALAVAQIKKNGAMAMLAQANVSQDIVTYLLKKYIS
jgi:hypothetical protein